MVTWLKSVVKERGHMSSVNSGLGPRILPWTLGCIIFQLAKNLRACARSDWFSTWSNLVEMLDAGCRKTGGPGRAAIRYLSALSQDYSSHKASGHAQPLPRGLHLRVRPLGAM